MVQEEKEKQFEALQAKNMMLQQQIGKLKEHSSQMKELFVAEHANWSTGQEDLHDQIKCLEIELLEEQTKNEEPTTGVVSEQARPTPDWTAEQKAALPQANRDGQISRDYAREFPSVEVGGRQVMKNEELRTSLQTVQLESEEVDSDEEWQRLVKTTEPGSPATLPSDPDFVSRLKERLQGARVQLG
ncbi:hypothetical protein EOD39_7261 [Acipenser ruthenus]|uniref:Uncharacterized protein n=1 Tax=Acipenser ruthenus TaxID=7906 RepID=A0A444U7G3_ACIRT|nr:hypothetical protein EOD39_7261 [Acipenser ruthenus]